MAAGLAAWATLGGVACGGEADVAEEALTATPAATRTIVPFLAGTRPVFATNTPEPTEAAPARTPVPSPATPTLPPATASVARVASGGLGAVEDEEAGSLSVEPEPTATPAVCPRGEIGSTGIEVVGENFFASRALRMPSFQPGLESDFYTAHNPRWLIWMLVFDIPEGGAEAELTYRWGQVVSGQERVMVTGEWGVLESGGDNVRAAGLGGDAPGFWLPGSYFVDAWSDLHECAVSSWRFEVH